MAPAAASPLPCNGICGNLPGVAPVILGNKDSRGHKNR
jgi:hypothetical protein